MTVDPAIITEAIEWRHAMHTNPGIAYNEEFASNLVQTKLAQWGVEHETGWGKNPNTNPLLKGKGGHGVVATIHGNGAGDVIGLRADMDALPIDEQTNLEWFSQNPGLMHACGHDGHTATLLAVAKHFSDAANCNFNGTLKLIFQPAEEGTKGAKAMIDEGLFEKHPVDAVFAMHNWPELELGQIAVHPGPVMASSAYFDIDIKGQSAHVAKFDRATSAIRLAGKIIDNFPQSTREGNFSNWHSTEFTHVNAGSPGARGVIPGAGLLQGSIRTFDPKILESIKSKIQGLASEFSAKAEFRDGSPATINTAAEAKIVRIAAEQIVGAENVQWDISPELTAEDFGFMLKEVPGCYFWVGQNPPNDENSPNNRALHNDGYDFNDDIIQTAAETFVNLVHHRLG